ncbi:hypothetical protein C8J57DRAFT_1253354 [Mycena rebaudengoi]|nr:hypothetical protein C8J57DRAFT_1253354 [Mycena rebaudengoi]
MSEMRASLEKLDLKLDKVVRHIKTAWSLSEAQQIALKALLGNYFLRPLITYRSVIESAMTYIGSHRSKYHLEHFLTDEVAKTTIKAFLCGKVSDIKSGYRKLRVHYPLAMLADTMISDYHLSPASIKDEEKVKIHAVLALQQKLALPLAARRNAKGADTSFWWEQEIIAADIASHSGEAGESSQPHSEDEDQNNEQNDDEQNDEQNAPITTALVARA